MSSTVPWTHGQPLPLTWRSLPNSGYTRAHQTCARPHISRDLTPQTTRAALRHKSPSIERLQKIKATQNIQNDLLETMLRGIIFAHSIAVVSTLYNKYWYNIIMTQHHVLIHTYKCSRKWAVSEQKYWIVISGLKGQGKAQVAPSLFSLANILYAKVYYVVSQNTMLQLL